MRITRLNPEGYTRSPWKNGGGITTDIAEARLPGSLPGSWEGLIWRLGRTGISVSAPFSDMAGFDRCQMVIAGSGLVLETPQGEVDLRQPLVTAAYPGEAPITSRLENGPVEVINLIADRALVAIRLMVIRAGETMQTENSLCICHASVGAAALSIGGDQFVLEPDHALCVVDGTHRMSVSEGAIVAAIVRQL